MGPIYSSVSSASWYCLKFSAPGLVATMVGGSGGGEGGGGLSFSFIRNLCVCVSNRYHEPTRTKIPQCKDVNYSKLKMHVIPQRCLLNLSCVPYV